MFDDASIDIPCPNCGHKNPKTIRWIKSHNELVCAGCNRTIALEKESLMRGLQQVDKSTKDFKSPFRKVLSG